MSDALFAIGGTVALITGGTSGIGLMIVLRAAATSRDPARIINIRPIGGLHIPSWEAFPYGASNAALHHLSPALAKRLGWDPITVHIPLDGGYIAAL